MEKEKNNLTFDIKKKVFNLLIPYYIVCIIWYTFFVETNSLNLIFRVILFDNIVPYCWYVKTQLILYFIWWIALKFKEQYKMKNKYFLTFIFLSLIIYSFYQYFNLITSTTYITVFNFVFGILYSHILKDKIINLNKLKLICLEIVLLFIVILFTIIFPRENNILSYIVINIVSGLFSIFIFNTLFLINYRNVITNYYGKISYYIYIVQCIAQCILQKTYFCNKSFLSLNNNILVLFGTLFLDIIIATILYLISKTIIKYFNKEN